MHFFHPEAANTKNQISIYPAFIPFLGCKTRCIFCSQNAQTGRQINATPVKIEELLHTLELDILSKVSTTPLELAFYGGTFTAMSEKDQRLCLDFAAKLKKSGKIQRLRCSTRPDCITPKILAELKEQGLDALELGIQSFSDIPLEVSRRGYSGKQAEEACLMLKESALEAGIQLMPGMPGMQQDDFIHDMQKVQDLAPATLRLYPCLVLAGTELAHIWERGEYTTWPLELCVELLAATMLKAWSVNSKVIRIGLAPEPALAPNILAGPVHPALGQMARSEALFLFIQNKIVEFKHSSRESSFEKAQYRQITLYAPRRFQGEFFGHKNSLLAKYQELGLDKSKVFWWDEEHFMLE